MKKRGYLPLLLLCCSALANWAQHVDYISQQFLGKIYQNNPNGEGEHGDFDQADRLSLTRFDCQTYVDTTLAMSLATGWHPASEWIESIRYHGNPHQFIMRNHFVSAQQNPVWHALQISHDVTDQIFDKMHKPLSKTKDITIRVSSWLMHLPHSRLRMDKPLVDAWQRFIAQKSPDLHASITYISIHDLFKDNQPILEIWAQFPDHAILEIVQPDWDIEKIIGTPILVSHLGFIFRKDKTLILRHASQRTARVIEEPLADYLVHYQNTPVGIHLEALNTQTPPFPLAH